MVPHLPLSPRVSRSASRRFSPRLWIAAAVVAGTCLTGSVAAASAAGPKVRQIAQKTELEKGLAFYRGQTITLIVPSNAGGVTDVAARDTAVAMAVFLHATINIEDLPGGSEAVGSTAAAHANPNGLTFGTVVTSIPIQDNVLGNVVFNFNFEHVPFLGSAPAVDQTIASLTSSPYTKWQQIFNSSSPLPMVTGLPTGNTIFARLFAAAFPELNIKPLDAYTSTTASLAGFLRGDAQLSFDTLADNGPAAANNEARVLLEYSVPPKVSPYYKILKSVPTFAEVAAKYPPKTAAEKLAYKTFNSLVGLPVLTFFAPIGTGGPQVTALQAALKFSLLHNSVESQYSTIGLTPGWYSGAQTKSIYITAYAAAAADASVIKGP